MNKKVLKLAFIMVCNVMIALGVILTLVAAFTVPAAIIFAGLVALGSILSAVAVCEPIKEEHLWVAIIIGLIGAVQLPIGIIAIKLPLATLGYSLLWVGSFLALCVVKKDTYDRREASRFRAEMRARLRAKRRYIIR